jgi:hypothetical protein
MGAHSNKPWPAEELQRRSPAIFAPSAHERTSSAYTFSTERALDARWGRDDRVDGSVRYRTDTHSLRASLYKSAQAGRVPVPLFVVASVTPLR